MTDPEEHENVGAKIFEYAHVLPGRKSRMAIYVRPGDNPDWWKARIQMHGAQFVGECAAVIRAHDPLDTGASEAFPVWVLIYGGASTFKAYIPATDAGDAIHHCREIGGFRLPQLGPPSLRDRWRDIIRFLWTRRPTIRLRGPLDCF